MPPAGHLRHPVRRTAAAAERTRAESGPAAVDGDVVRAVVPALPRPDAAGATRADPPDAAGAARHRATAAGDLTARRGNRRTAAAARSSSGPGLPGGPPAHVPTVHVTRERTSMETAVPASLAPPLPSP